MSHVTVNSTGAFNIDCYILIEIDLKIIWRKRDYNSCSRDSAGPGIIWVVVVLLREEPEMQNSEGKLYVRTKKNFLLCLQYMCVLWGVHQFLSRIY